MSQKTFIKVLETYALMTVRIAHAVSKIVIRGSVIVATALFSGVCISIGLLLFLFAALQSALPDANLSGLLWLIGQTLFMGGVFIPNRKHLKVGLFPFAFMVTVLGAIGLAFGVANVPFTYTSAAALGVFIISMIGLCILLVFDWLEKRLVVFLKARQKIATPA